MVPTAVRRLVSSLLAALLPDGQAGSEAEATAIALASQCP